MSSNTAHHHHLHAADIRPHVTRWVALFDEIAARFVGASPAAHADHRARINVLQAATAATERRRLQRAHTGGSGGRGGYLWPEGQQLAAVRLRPVRAERRRGTECCDEVQGMALKREIGIEGIVVLCLSGQGPLQHHCAQRAVGTDRTGHDRHAGCEERAGGMAGQLALRDGAGISLHYKGVRSVTHEACSKPHPEPHSGRPAEGDGRGRGRPRNIQTQTHLEGTEEGAEDHVSQGAEGRAVGGYKRILQLYA